MGSIMYFGCEYGEDLPEGIRVQFRAHCVESDSLSRMNLSASGNSGILVFPTGLLLEFSYYQGVHQSLYMNSPRVLASRSAGLRSRRKERGGCFPYFFSVRGPAWRDDHSILKIY